MLHLLASLVVSSFLIAQPQVPRPAAPQDQVQQERLMATLRSLPTSRAALGDAASQDGLRKTEDLLIKALTDFGYTPTTQEFKWALPMQNRDKPADPSGAPPSAKPRDHTWRNIIVNIPGKELPGEVLIIGAHFDAVPGTPGADDNGTGTAALVELARVLKEQPMKRSVRLIFFTLEEVGLIGSKNYVRSLREAGIVGQRETEAPDGAPPPKDTNPPREKIIGMVSLEMLGYFSDEPNSQRSPIKPIKGIFEPPTVGNTIAMIGFHPDQEFVKNLDASMKSAAPDLKISAFAFPLPLPDLMRSDHYHFYAAGVPAVMLTDTANFRNPNYHKPTDTVETIDAKRFTLVVKGLAGAICDVAGIVKPTPKSGQ